MSTIVHAADCILKISIDAKFSIVFSCHTTSVLHKVFVPMPGLVLAYKHIRLQWFYCPPNDWVLQQTYVFPVKQNQFRANLAVMIRALSLIAVVSSSAYAITFPTTSSSKRSRLFISNDMNVQSLRFFDLRVRLLSSFKEEVFNKPHNDFIDAKLLIVP